MENEIVLNESLSSLEDIVKNSFSERERPVALLAVVVPNTGFRLENGEILQRLEGRVLGFKKFRRLYETRTFGSAILCESADSVTGLNSKGMQACKECASRKVCSIYGLLVIQTKNDFIALQLPPKKVSGVEYQFLSLALRGVPLASLYCEASCAKSAIVKIEERP